MRGFSYIFFNRCVVSIKLASKPYCYSRYLLNYILHCEIFILNFEYFFNCLLLVACLPLHALYSLDSRLVLNIFGVAIFWWKWLLFQSWWLLDAAKDSSTEWVFVVSLWGFLLFGGVFFICDDLQRTWTWLNDSAKQFWWSYPLVIASSMGETPWTVSRHNFFDGVNFCFDLLFYIFNSHDFWLGF